jgi:hypothetical protein
MMLPNYSFLDIATEESLDFMMNIAQFSSGYCDSLNLQRRIS